MSEVLSSLLSAVKPRPELAKRGVESACRFVLDEVKFFADIVEERGSLQAALPIRPDIAAAATSFTDGRYDNAEQSSRTS